MWSTTTPSQEEAEQFIARPAIGAAPPQEPPSPVREFFGGAGTQAKEIGEGLLRTPETLTRLGQGTPGFLKGVVSAPRQTGRNMLEALSEMAKAQTIGTDPSESRARRAGRLTTNVAAIAGAPFISKGAHALTKATKKATIGTYPIGVETQFPKKVAAPRAAAPTAQAPKPASTAPGVPPPVETPRAGGRTSPLPTPARNILEDERGFAGRLPAQPSERRMNELVQKLGGQGQGEVTLPHIEQMPHAQGAEAVQGMRAMYGAEDAAARLDLPRQFQALGGGHPERGDISKWARQQGVNYMREAAPGPSRLPLRASNAMLDAEFKRKLADPKGAIRPRTLASLGGGSVGAIAAPSLLNADTPEEKWKAMVAGAFVGATLHQLFSKKTARGIQAIGVGEMLSGLALPRSAWGNIGTPFVAALEGKGLGPARELYGRPLKNLRVAKQEWARGANPAQVAGATGSVQDIPWWAQPFTLPGRAMGALDAATIDALKRGGLTPGQAGRYTLTESNPAAAAIGGNTVVGKFSIPFQRTPFNQARGLLENLSPTVGTPSIAQKMREQMIDVPLRRRQAISAGAAGAGAIGGELTDDPRWQGLPAAFLGPYGGQYLIGAALNNLGRPGRNPARLLSGLTPVPEFSLREIVMDPTRRFTDPAITRLFK